MVWLGYDKLCFSRNGTPKTAQKMYQACAVTRDCQLQQIRCWINWNYFCAKKDFVRTLSHFAGIQYQRFATPHSRFERAGELVARN